MASDWFGMVTDFNWSSKTCCTFCRTHGEMSRAVQPGLTQTLQFFTTCDRMQNGPQWLELDLEHPAGNKS